MCRIAGFSLHPDDDLDAVLLARQMLLACEHLGPDATGAAWHDPDGTWYDRAPVRARHYVDRLPMSPLATTAILHTRYATGGHAARPELNRNNHPFPLPGVTGIHNGVITNPGWLHGLYGTTPTAATDSEALFAALSARPDGATRADVLREVEGDAAVAWLETEFPTRLYLARLEGRPVAVAHTEGKSLLFASTAAILTEAARKAEVRLRMQTIRTLPEWTYLVVEGGTIRRVDRLQPERQPLWDTAAALPNRRVDPALRLGDLAGTVTADPRPGKSKWVPAADRAREERERAATKPQPRKGKGKSRGRQTATEEPLTPAGEKHWAWARYDGSRA